MIWLRSPSMRRPFAYMLRGALRARKMRSCPAFARDAPSKAPIPPAPMTAMRIEGAPAHETSSLITSLTGRLPGLGAIAFAFRQLHRPLRGIRRLALLGLDALAA